MAKKTAAERYATRKQRVAIDLRIRTLIAADVGARHARLRDKYGPDWKGKLIRSINQQTADWLHIVESNPYRRPSDPEFGPPTAGDSPKPWLRRGVV